MQFTELNLRAYGPFTGKVLSFGSDTGLHIISGPNEAGKSTILRALRNVLFGMDARDAHLHPADMLRVGLKIKLANGEVLDVERRKGKGLKTLVFANTGKPVPVEEWARVLPVNDADLFEQMFGLDYQRLVAGGKELATFGGDIGQTILAASGDLGETIKAIQSYQDRASEIYAPQASSRLLNRALREFKAAEGRIRSERFSSQQYKAAINRAIEVDQELTRIAVDLAHATAEHSKLTRLQTAAPHADILAQAQTELESLKDVVLLPATFEEEYTRLTQRREQAAVQKRTAEKELGFLAQQLTDIRRQPELAAVLSQVNERKEQAGGIQKARIDLPKVGTELRECVERRQNLCTDWKLNPEALPQIPAEQRKQIEALAKEHATLQAKREDLPRRISALESRRQHCEAEIAAIAVSTETAAIRQVLKQIPAKRQSGAETQRLRRERDALRAELQSDLASLPLWKGTAQDLETIRVPLPVSVNEMQTRMTKAQTLLEQARKERERLAKDAEAIKATLLHLEQHGPIPTENDLAAARARRDLGWHAVKESWLEGLGDGGDAARAFLAEGEQPLPDLFEASIMAADSVGDRLRLEAERVEQKRSAMGDLERVTARIADHALTIEGLQRDNAALISEWQALWSDTGVQPRSPGEMTAWIEERKLLIEKLRDLRRLDGNVAEAEAEECAWCELLTNALQIAHGQSLLSLVGLAEAKAADMEAVSKRRDEWKQSLRETQRSLDAELGDQRINREQFGEWEKRWAKTIAGLPVNVQSEPGSARELLQVIMEVKSASDEIAKLQHRIGGMQRDEREYSGQVSAIARNAGRPDLVSIDPLLAVHELQKLARTAYDNELEAERLTKEKARREQDLGTAAADIECSDSELDDLLKRTGVRNDGHVAEAIDDSKRKAELTKAIREQVRALAQSAGSTPVDTFLNEIRTASIEARQNQVQELEQRIRDLEGERAEMTREQERIQSDFRLREDANMVSIAACEKHSAAARIEFLLMEFVQNYMRAELLKKAVALYGDKHQDPLLRRAGEYFQQLTCGGFAGVVVEQRRDGRGPKAARKNGDSISVEGLSDGTRDQLFLALRLAYIENHCCMSEPCPVILDDVLMAFDDRRAVAALRALRSLSEKTQVLIFTHHAHHVTLAEEVLGSGFALHDLSAGSSLAA